MRLRFFLIIFIGITTTATLFLLVHFYYMKSERLRLIDNQLRDSATILINSDLPDLQKINLEEAEAVISEELGSSRIGKIFVVRNQQGETMFASASARTLGVEMPRSPQWVTLETAKHFVRILNLEVPKRPDRTLQVGLVLDANFLDWSGISNRIFVLIAAIVFLGSCVSGLLAMVLLAPFQKLNFHLERATSDMQNLKDVRSLPIGLLNVSTHFWSKTDEFVSLLNNIQKLIERINQNYRILRIWTSRMAHELKTPLTILRAGLERRLFHGTISKDGYDEALKEVESIAGIVTEFLAWAELEQFDKKAELHAIKAGDLVRTLRQRYEKVSPGRVVTRIEDNLTVLTFPPHLEQLINNLISNALKYSSGPVEVVVRCGIVEVRDCGEGLPGDVLERLGQPFNRGANSFDFDKSSSGLGLAIASSIAKLYRWDLNFECTDAGTVARLDFQGSCPLTAGASQASMGSLC